MESNFKQTLAKAVLTMLKPMLRVLIRNEVSHAEFAELARQAYVDVAYEHYSIPGRKTTYSRVAVLTGLSRKEVVRLHKLQQAQQPLAKPTPNRAVRVINGWLQDPEFLLNQKPKVLPLQGEQGSFASLVAKYSGDITLGAVVDELERIGVVSRPDKNTVKLTSYGYVPQEDELEKINIMSVCAADLLNTTVHNLEKGEQDARFQRQIAYTQTTQKVAEEFRQYSGNKSAEFLQQLNQFLSQKTRNETTHEQGNRRVGLGIYYFENVIQKENEDDV